MTVPPPPEAPRRRSFPLPGLIIGPAIVTLLLFLIITPEALLVHTGDWLLAKTSLIGYAVCHQIRSHSIIINGHQLPLCARCSGTFIGALVGLFGQIVVLRRQRAVQFPPVYILVILGLFMILWGGDGLNSYMATIVRGPHLYQPQHELRLITGALNGLTMSALILPAFNATLWQRPTPEPTIRNLRDLGVLLLLEGGAVGLVLASARRSFPIEAGAIPILLLGPGSFPGWLGKIALDVVLTLRPFMIYPLSILGALGVLTLLTSVNTMLVVIAIRRENTADQWRDSLIPLLAGFTITLIQIGAIDAIRYTLTGTFSSFLL